MKLKSKSKSDFNDISMYPREKNLQPSKSTVLLMESKVRM